MRTTIVLFSLLLLLAASAFSATTKNDDSCDIALQPAATLLLPYFEVDFKAAPTSASQTLFTIQNVTGLPQIANVTLWTDAGYAAFSFPIFLTGYDVHPINLYDVFAYGNMPGTSPQTTIPTNPTPGSQPVDNTANPNFLPDVATACAQPRTKLSAPLLLDLQLIFTTGQTGIGIIGCSSKAGSTHTAAIGYATIDVVATCSAKNPSSSDYFAGTALFDNVLTGDYQQVVPRGSQSYAQGGPLVHIRAIPEGGAAGSTAATDLPYTFYDRYTAVLPQRTADRRQPLPAAFAPRYIQGGKGGFETSFKLWRETKNAGACSGTEAASLATQVNFREMVRFDEHENATVASGGPIDLFPLIMYTTAAVVVPTTSILIPPLSASGDVGGWLYMNLDSGDRKRASQNWVITSMFAEPTYAVEW
ncbi:MAG TPA: hypothetical protein VG323_12360, partial [Thermoanaerobaculia bacterium]|nr:hypothetical protein [Thermoanaerobaculia bacterium]